MSTTPAPTPSLPNQALPAWMRAGDVFNFVVQTTLPQGTLVFFVLTGIISNVPTRIVLGAATSGGSGAVLVDANGQATFAIPGATTDTWAPGWYEWIAFAVDANGNRSSFANGRIRIQPDPNGAAPIDPRSYNQKLLGAIRTLLSGKALDDTGMYKIGNRELTKYSIKDLMFWEAVVEGRVRRERIRKGQYVPTSTRGITFGGRY